MIWAMILMRLKSGLTTLWGVVCRNPWQAAVIALSVAFLWTLHGKHAAQAEVAAMKLASKQATVAQIAVNHEPAAKSQAIAEKSNAEAQDYYAKGRAAGLAYADAHGVRSACVPASAGLPGADHAAPVHDGQGDAPSGVAVSRADFDQLVANSLRLAKVHQDAESMIAAGIAVKDAN